MCVVVCGVGVDDECGDVLCGGGCVCECVDECGGGDVMGGDGDGVVGRVLRERGRDGDVDVGEKGEECVGECGVRELREFGGVVEFFGV